MRDGCLVAVLTRSKVSGQDKNVEALPVHVSSEAYLSDRTWLQVGFDLWQQAPRDRDFFLIMPNADRDGTMKIEVTYADALSMTKALFMSLDRPASTFAVTADTEKLFATTEAVSFWTEHSPRPSMASWVSCLAQFPQGWVDLLGRWGASGGEGYVRTHRTRVHLMQEAVAKSFREDKDPYKIFGESHLLDSLRIHLEAKGIDQATVLHQMACLTLISRTVECDATPLLRIPDMLSDASDEETTAIPEVGNHIVDLQGMFVVGISRSVRRLHRVGLCHRLPGVHYKNFEVIGPDMPTSGFTARCGHC